MDLLRHCGVRTLGYEAGDGGAGAWSVRWVTEPDRITLVEPPVDVDVPAPVCRLVMATPGFTSSPAADAAGGAQEDFSTAEALEEALQEAWLAQRTGSTEGYPTPVSHVQGHSRHGEINARALVDEVLPLRVPGDEHRLIRTD